VAPWSESQRRLFNAAAHDKDIAEEHGMSDKEARKLADEANKLKKEGREKKASFVDLSRVYDNKPSER
jgi:hypothetical protein